MPRSVMDTFRHGRFVYTISTLMLSVLSLFVRGMKIKTGEHPGLLLMRANLSILVITHRAHSRVQVLFSLLCGL